MKTLLVGSVLALITVAMIASTASAQFGVGVRVPPEVFLAYHMSESVMLEAWNIICRILRLASSASWE